MTPDYETEIRAPSHTWDQFHPDRFHKLVDETIVKVRELKEKYPEIEALAACGHSGLMLVGAVSYALNMPQIAVRKSADTEHDCYLADGWMGCRGYLVVDDLINSGDTIRRIRNHIRDTSEYFDRKPKMVGVLLYMGYSPDNEKYDLKDYRDNSSENIKVFYVHENLKTKKR
jgi:hypoxanthine phosphoribosyltransferase